MDRNRDMRRPPVAGWLSPHQRRRRREVPGNLCRARPGPEGPVLRFGPMRYEPEPAPGPADAAVRPVPHPLRHHPRRPAHRLSPRRPGRLPAGPAPRLPETKRIWWRNIEPLAAAGLRGGPPPTCGATATATSRRRRPRPRPLQQRRPRAGPRRAGPRALRSARRRPRRPVAIDLATRFEGFVDQLCFFNSVPLGQPRVRPVDLQRAGRRTHRRLPGPPGPPARRARGDAAPTTPPGASGWLRCTPAGSGRRRAPSPPKRSTS